MQLHVKTDRQTNIASGLDHHARLPVGHRRQVRGGFTLLELMLVLAVLVVLMAMVAPSLHRPLQNYKLRKGADHVLAILGKAQLRAIRSGQVQVMLFMPGTGQLMVQTFATDQDMIEFSSQTMTPGMQPITIEPIVALSPLMETLPDGVVFVEAQTTDDIRDQLTQQQTSQGAMNQTMLSQSGIPLMFYPDGTSSTARLILTNGLDAFVVLDLRGLTGVANVSGLLSAEEVEVL